MNITAPSFDNEELELLEKCLDSGWVTQGPLTRQFETLFLSRHQVQHALAATSCTAALHLATMALGLKHGDEVVVPAFTWVTSAYCAEYVGAKVVLADVELGTFNLDPAALEDAISPATRAVVVVHLFGLSARMDEIMRIANRHQLKVIEDAACAVGTTYSGKPVGGIGNLGCFSFHPRKVITTGEGGMVTTNDPVLAQKVSYLRNHGASPSFELGEDSASRPYYMADFNLLGFNLRMSDIQAAVGVAQMAKLDALLDHRQVCGARYNELLSSIDEIAVPFVPPKCSHTYQSYVIRLLDSTVGRRNRVMDAMKDEGIQTRPGTHAVHRLGYYREKYDLRPEDFPRSSAAEDQSITLPLFPEMTDQDQERVVQSLRSALAKS